MMKTKIRVSLKGKKQLPWLMVIKEYYLNNGKFAWAEVLFEIWPTKIKDLKRFEGR
jgi:hypothetical protein